MLIQTKISPLLDISSVMYSIPCQDWDTVHISKMSYIYIKKKVKIS